MICHRLFISTILIATSMAGCAFIAGPEDAGLSGKSDKHIRLNYVETLRNQASLRGDSFRDVIHSVSTPSSLQRPNLSLIHI